MFYYLFFWLILSFLSEFQYDKLNFMKYKRQYFLAQENMTINTIMVKLFLIGESIFSYSSHDN
ncbi:hypothetical protein AFK69_06855 [Xenorhabdus sp. GDc328]|nr:hypothetical protein AAY47_08630 [Xenorhabdus griffiniae]KOP34092.1 hypothetical protein AFK69_06855 [Xenorhabdus sp. GDc328]